MTNYSSPPDRLRRYFSFAALAALLAILGLSGHALAADPPKPVAAISLPGTAFIGEDVTFTVAFDNASATTTAVGYGPYIDLFLPSAGADGTGAALDDGLTFNNANYLGTPVAGVVQACPAGGSVVHPLTGLNVSCPAGRDSELVTLQLPFGSFVPDQPPVVITVNAALSNLADLGTPLPVVAQAGFELGADPLDNPNTDPPILQTPPATADLTPTLYTIAKTYLGPEGETATGPSFVRQYEIVVDIAAGQPLSPFVITENLPPEVQYWEPGGAPDIVAANGVNCRATAQPSSDSPHSNVPANLLEITCDTLTGTMGAQDLVVTFDFFVPEYYENGRDSAGWILDADNGGCKSVENDVTSAGTWTPIDGRDPQEVVNGTEDPNSPDETFKACALVIQKQVASGGLTSAGIVLEYQYDIQVSDYFTLGGNSPNSLTIDPDVLSDGQLLLFDQYNGTDEALMSWTDRAGTTTAGLADGDALDVDTSQNPDYADPPGSPADACGNGTTTLTMDLSKALIEAAPTSHPNATVVGACVLPGNGDPGDTQYPCNPSGPDEKPEVAATAMLNYKVQVQDNYACNAGDPSIDMVDYISNAVDIAGDVLDNNTQAALPAPDGGPTTDDSGLFLRLPAGQLEKTVYARNGVIGDTGPFQPGDTVTYRLTYRLPVSDLENFRFVDYLPLPVLRADDPDGNLAAGPSWTFNPTVSPAPPPAGGAKYGPDDTFSTLVGGNPSPSPAPVVSADAVANSLAFDYGDYDDPGQRSSVMDILFTTTVNNEPFADRLFLTNQVRAIFDNTFGEETTADDIVQIQLLQPHLRVEKGYVQVDPTVGGEVFSPSTTGPVTFNQGACPSFSGTVDSNSLSATPIDSDLSGVDAGDKITAAVVVENDGSYPAYDVQLKDLLPAPFTAGMVSNLCVMLGDGTTTAYTGSLSDFFSTGISLNNALAAGKTPTGEVVTTGANIALVSYDITVPSGVTALTDYTNTATVTNYASISGGPDFTETFGEPSDTATVTTLPPSIAKKLVTTEIVNANNELDEAVIGELITYQIDVTFPEGSTPSVSIQDTLDTGLAFVSCDSITATAGLSSSLGAFGCSMVSSVTSSGRIITLNLGSITNSNTDNATAEKVSFVYKAVMLNTVANQSGQGRDNAARVTFGSGGSSGPVSADSVTIIEPTLDVQKDVVVDGSGTTGDAYDTAVYTIVIKHPGSSETDAYDFTLNDPLPAPFTSPSLTSVTSTGGCAYGPSDFTIDGTPTLKTVAPLDVPLGCQITIQVTGTIAGTVAPGQTIDNTASIQWTSLDGTPNDGRNTYNSVGVERTGNTSDPGGAANDYRDSDPARITIINPIVDKKLVSTNQAHTTGLNVAIGEIATYEVTIAVPEGVYNNVTVVDTLDTGLAFVDCASITASTGLATTAGGGFGGVCSNAVFTSSGRIVTFAFGNITNTDNNDATPETITITYRAVVLNSVNNNRGDVRDNNVQVIATAGTLTKDGPDLVIVEPELQVAKDASPVTGDAGDAILFTLTIQHTGASNADAFNIELSDILPAGKLNYASPTLDCDDGALDPTTCAFTGNTLNATWDSFPVGAGNVSIIKFTATLDPGVQPGEVITNIGKIQWTSLPGDVGTAQSIYNALSVERTGDTTDVGGAVNDYRAEDPAQVTIGGEPSKAVATTSEALTLSSNLSIGEIVRYRLVYKLPEGTATNFIMGDNLPDGLQFLNDNTARVAFVANGAGISSSALSGAGLNVTGNEVTAPGVTPAFVLPDAAVSASLTADDNTFGSGTDVYFKLGNLSNADSDADDELIILEFNALVLSIPANTAGDVLPNNYDVYKGTTPTKFQTSNTVNVALVEPSVSIDKQVTTAPIDAGDTVVYEIVVTNANTPTTGPADDVRVQDVLNTSLDLQSVVVNSVGITVTDNSDTGAGNKVDVTLDPMKPGETATIVVTAKVVNLAEAGAVIPNVASLGYSSLPGPKGTTSNPTGSQTPGNPGEQNGERTYTGSDNVSVTLAAPTLVKLAPNPTLYTIGDLVTYYIRATMPEGVTKAVVITDDLPQGLKYVSHTIVTTAVGSAGNLTADFAGSFQTAPPTFNQTAGDGHDLTWSFGNVTTTADNNPNNNSFLVKVVVVVRNESTPLNLAGGMLTNSAKLDYTDAQNAPKSVDGGQQTIGIVEPQITTVKSVNPTIGVLPGQKVEYTVSFENTGGSTAYDVTAEDILAQGVAYTTNPSPLQCKDSNNITFPSQVTITNGGARLQFSGTAGNPWTLAVGNKLTCTYYVIALWNLAPNTNHINVVDADWTSQPGTGPANEERVYNDSDPRYTVDGDQDEDDAVFTTLGAAGDSACLDGVGVRERTDILGVGMGSTTKIVATAKVVIPNSTDAVSLYGQLAGKKTIILAKYGRFIYPNGKYEDVKPLALGPDDTFSPAYRDNAVYWFGTDLTPAANIRGKVFTDRTAKPFTQRAFILYPTYRTADLSFNYWDVLEDSTKNHVYWEPGWYNNQVLNIPIETPIAPVDILVQAAVVDNDTDTRPFTITFSAGGVTQTFRPNNPSNKDMLNLFKVTLPAVPPGTDTVTIYLNSAGPTQLLPLGDDSVALTGVAVNYSCVIP